MSKLDQISKLPSRTKARVGEAKTLQEQIPQLIKHSQQQRAWLAKISNQLQVLIWLSGGLMLVVGLLAGMGVYGVYQLIKIDQPQIKQYKPTKKEIQK